MIVAGGRSVLGTHLIVENIVLGDVENTLL